MKKLLSMKCSIYCKLFLNFSFLLFFHLSIIAQDVYVSPSGDNSNSGTISSPFATIQKALDVISPGNTIFVRGGTYKERLTWVTSGTPGNYIVLTNYNNETVVINGNGATNDSQNTMFDISNMSYIVIENMIITENFRNDAEGFYFTGSGTDITIKGCELYNIGWSNDPNANANSNNNAHAIVFIGSQAESISNITIENNNLHNCITGWSESMTMVGNIDGFVIQNNIVRDNTNIGIDLAGFWTWTGAPAEVNFSRNGLIKGNLVANCVSSYATSAGIYTDGAISITIENNTISGCGMGIEIGMENNDEVYGIIVRDNILYQNLESGLYLGAYAKKGMVRDSKVTGNTFYHNDMGKTMSDWTGEISLQKNTNCEISNNIIYPRDAQNKKALVLDSRSTTNLLLDYNLYWRASGDMSFLNDWGSGNTYTADTHKIETDPQFVNASGSDFHILETSPAIDGGNPNYVAAASEVDMDGQIRIYNSIIDCGADEISSAASPVLSVNPTVLTGYTYVEGSGPSPSKSFIISGTSLEGSQVTINAPANYEVSLDNISFASSLNLNYSMPTLANTTVYIRLKNGLIANDYNNELLTCNDNGTVGSVTIVNNGTVTNSTPLAPDSPSNLVASSISSSQIDITWSDNSSNEIDFEIQRSLTGIDGWSQIAVVNADVINYSDLGLTESTTYYYRVRAQNTAGDSNWSAIDNASTQSGSVSSITIDGDVSDWATISTLATESGQNLTSLKVTDDATKIYILLEGSHIAKHTEIFINSDNNANTGYNSPDWNNSGADYMVQNNELFSSNNTGWAWQSLGVSGVEYVKTSSVIELSIKKSLVNLNSIITIGAADLKANWSIVSKIPSAGNFVSYTLATGQLKVGMENKSFQNNLNNDNKKDITILQAYPNPFISFTKIRYKLTVESDVIIKVYGINGNIVVENKSLNKSIGFHEYQLDASLLKPGFYTISVQTSEFKNNIKVLLIK